MRASESERPFAALKLRVYQRGVIVGILITTLLSFVMWFGKLPTSPSDLIIPLMAVLCLGSLILFKALGTRFLKPFELTIFVIVYTYYVAHFGLLLLQGPHLPLLDFRNFDQWLPLLYILAFLIFPTRRALLLSTAFLVFILGFGILYGLLNLGRTIDWQSVSFLVQVYASNLIYLSMLYIIALLKDRYGEAERRSVQMTHLAMSDELTGVHNRRKITHLLNGFLADYQEAGTPLSILMLDMDDLKSINDTFGHHAGDQVLRKVAEVLRSNCRETDQIGRLSGDEFLILCPNTTAEQVLRLSKRLTLAIHKAEFGTPGRVYLSLGAATCQPEDTPECLTKRADEALYAAKRGKPQRIRRKISRADVPR